MKTMATATASQAYGEPWYWDKRYTGESESFDWYQKYPSLAPLVNLYVPRRSSKILSVGCGNSAFSEEMVDDGYEEVINVDISSVVIEAMKMKYTDRPQLKYMVMDVRNMSAFRSGSFDAVLDKGTLDSLLCGRSNTRHNADIMLDEVARVLKDRGVYILITYGTPRYRLPLLRDMNIWTVKLHVIDKFVEEGKSEDPARKLTDPISFYDNGSSMETLLGENANVHYIYICTKVGSTSSSQSHESKAVE